MRSAFEEKGKKVGTGRFEFAEIAEPSPMDWQTGYGFLANDERGRQRLWWVVEFMGHSNQVICELATPYCQRFKEDYEDWLGELWSNEDEIPL